MEDTMFKREISKIIEIHLMTLLNTYPDKEGMQNRFNNTVNELNDLFLKKLAKKEDDRKGFKKKETVSNIKVSK